MDNQLMEIGRRIDEAIEKAGLSRSDLGAVLGVGEGAVGTYIRGVSDAGAVRLTKIAKRCGVSISWIMTGDGQGPGEHSTTNETQTPYGSLDRELAGEVVTFLFDIANELGVTLNPKKAKELFLMINDEFAQTQQIDRAKVVQLVRLAA